ncbi:hypothetical protein BG006_008802 [Podila minutissima]|uniref:Uncharacterized protein n=1 Tax=Podila minutissima TaxID=64525 RepID=A0A9P5STR0_9FUNG|nr:hypothetical protein BG006_008802 [Podila minutissima]
MDVDEMEGTADSQSPKYFNFAKRLDIPEDAPATQRDHQMVEQSATLTSTGLIKSITDSESSLPPLRGKDANIDKYMAHHHKYEQYLYDFTTTAQGSRTQVDC